MLYRKLGKTGLEVSAIGLGCGELGSSRTEYAAKIVTRALELGVNYFDTARRYWDSEIKVGSALKGAREEVYISTKTPAVTREEAWQHIRESLQRLQTDYLDNCHLHNLVNEKDLERRVGSGGALEALVEARDQGLIRHIGCTSHLSRVLIRALEDFDFEIIMVPMNIVEREPLEELIPLCNRKGVGVTIMKPLATGILPARLALKWLLNQPIATAVPGTTTIEEVEEGALVGHLEDITLTNKEKGEVDRLATRLEHVRCRICYECEPCPKGIRIPTVLGTDMFREQYRTMGPEGFRFFPWSEEIVKNHLEERRQKMSAVRSCNECGECEEKCPYHLPIIRMLKETVEPMEDMLKIWSEQLGIKPTP